MSFVRSGYPAGGSAGYLTASAGCALLLLWMISLFKKQLRRGPHPDYRKQADILFSGPHSPAAKFESRSIPDRVISCFSRRGTCVTGYLQ